MVQNVILWLFANENPRNYQLICYKMNLLQWRVLFTENNRIMLNNALPVEFLTDSGSSVNIFNQDTFTKLDSLMSMTLDRSFAKVYQYGCKIPLPKLRKIVSSKLIRTVTTELLQHFMSLTLQHCVFLANLHWSYLVFFECSLANQVWANSCIN